MKCVNNKVFDKCHLCEIGRICGIADRLLEQNTFSTISPPTTQLPSTGYIRRVSGVECWRFRDRQSRKSQLHELMIRRRNCLFKRVTRKGWVKRYTLNGCIEMDVRSWIFDKGECVYDYIIIWLSDNIGCMLEMICGKLIITINEWILVCQ